MPDSPKYAFSARISGDWNEGQIERDDGETVKVSGLELLILLADLSAGGHPLPRQGKHFQMVLEEWFSRKTAQPRLRAVS